MRIVAAHSRLLRAAIKASGPNEAFDWKQIAASLDIPETKAEQIMEALHREGAVSELTYGNDAYVTQEGRDYIEEENAAVKQMMESSAKDEEHRRMMQPFGGSLVHLQPLPKKTPEPIRVVVTNTVETTPAPKPKKTAWGWVVFGGGILLAVGLYAYVHWIEPTVDDRIKSSVEPSVSGALNKVLATPATQP